MTEPGPLRDDEREPTQPIELEDAEPSPDKVSRVVSRSHSAPPPLPPGLRAARPGGSVPPPLPNSPERLRGSGVHRLERASLPAPPAAGSVPPPPPPAGVAPSRAPGPVSVTPPLPAGSASRIAGPAGSAPPPPALTTSRAATLSNPSAPSALGAAPRSASLPPASATPPVAAGAAAAELRALQDELRAVTAHRDRLRLRVVRQQERIEELESERAVQAAELTRLHEALAAAQRGAAADLTDLKRVQGIGPAFERSLKREGVNSLETIAAWSADDVVEMARRIGTTPHRIERDGWVRSARELLGKPPGA